MKRKTIIVLLGLLILASLACNLTVQLPDVPRIKTGPTIVDEISVTSLETADEVARLQIDFGAGELRINPGAGLQLVNGTASYNVSQLKPVVTQDGNEIQIRQGEFEFTGIPDFDGYKNLWELSLGADPITLRVNAGGYKASYEFGDLSLKELHINDGAADVDLSFSKPNRIPMEYFQYQTGASQVSLIGLANTNCADINFRSGAGDYTLDFSGELRQDTRVSIKSGFSNLELVVPADTNARVSFEAAVATVNVDGEWRQSGEDYILQGTGPQLTILIDMGAGNVNLATP